MKLKIGHVYNAMNPEEVAVAEATASLTELYKACDSLMTKSDNVEEMKVLVTRANSAYDCLTSLCSNLSIADLSSRHLYY